MCNLEQNCDFQRYKFNENKKNPNISIDLSLLLPMYLPISNSLPGYISDSNEMTCLVCINAN